MPDHFIRVGVPLFLPEGLDYIWRAETKPTIGQMVEVPVGRQTVHGTILEVLTHSAYQNLKEATPVLNDDGAPYTLPKQTLDFFRYVARYTLAAPGDPLRACLIKRRIPELGKRSKPYAAEPLPAAQVRLNEEQATAAEAIQKAEGTFAPMLLDGVTGSGKTEVYFAAIESLLKKQGGAQSLILVPEIALTPDWLTRFEQRFGFKPIAWHSGLTPAQRAIAWQAVYTGAAPVVVGARSALFLPWKNLSLVVVDEEHDPSYKQTEQFRYHGRDMAVVLAKFWNCPAVLASATPNLETFHNATSGKYQHLQLTQRHGDATLPVIKTIDLRNEELDKNQFISPKLEEKVNATLQKGEQALLFLNRRGTAPLLLCTECGHRIECPSCSANLTAHGTRMQCHYCGYTEQQPDVCPECESENTLRLFGPGTRRIVAEAQEKFPNARIAVADSDALTTANQMADLIEDMKSGQIDILVGTQMVAKGHNFPNLTMVGVLDGDMGLAQGDVRASERTFQLLTQVAGRAGRHATRGQVFIQTFEPDNPLFKNLISHDRDGFYAYELPHRKDWQDPPFGRLARLTITGKNESEVRQNAQKLAQNAPKEDSVRLLGPAPAPLAKLKDTYRYQLLLKSISPLQPYIQNWLKHVPLNKNIRVIIDIDSL